MAARAMGTPAGDSLVYSSFHRGAVLLPGADREVVRIKGPAAQPFWERAQTRFHYRVCYCSLYQDCWLYDTASEQDLPPAVDGCPVRPNDVED